MLFTVKDTISTIEGEIEWCDVNPCTQYESEEANKIYKLAFIKGLEQAKYIIQTMLDINAD